MKTSDMIMSYSKTATIYENLVKQKASLIFKQKNHKKQCQSYL